MLEKIKSFSKSLLVKFPPTAAYLKEKYLKRLFSVELDLINGRHHHENIHPSIIHFGLNRAATQYTKKILVRCAIENKIQPVHIHDYAFNTDFPYLDHLSAEEMKKYQHIFKQKGYLYSVFGGMVEGIPDLEKYKILLIVRDPRDILVSEFYSVAYSHQIPDKQVIKHEGFLKQRIKTRASGIDEYVIAKSDEVYNRFFRYKKLLVDVYPNVYVATYEQMVDDFQGWLKNVLNNCELKISTELLKSLIEENEQIKPKQEDIRKHLRKGKAGDYKAKLKPETIEYLNIKLSSTLDAFGYTKDSIS